MRLKRFGGPVMVAALAAACATVPRQDGPRRAIVLSLDGASADELWRLHEEGAFGPDGFERLLREGEAARRMVPVNPTLTAVNHISLATGATAARTGVVSNSFHVPGEAISKRADGFAAPVEAEFLWQAARRQGKRIGLTAWPAAGAAGTPSAGDWALLWTNALLRPSRIVDIAAADWTLVEESAGARLTSLAPLRRTRLELAAEKNFPAQTLELYALDRRDDGRVLYDAIAVRDPASERAVTLAPGDSEALVLVSEDASSPVAQGLELLTLDGDGRASLYLARLYRNAAYPESYARGLAERDILWPSPPDDDTLEAAWEGKPGLSLDAWVRQADRFAHFFFEALLTGLRSQPWDLVMAYLPTIDEAEHQLLLVDPRQPDWSGERQSAFAAARRRVWQGADREVARLLAMVDRRTTTVYVVSDHGLAPVHTAIDANAVLAAAGLLRVDEKAKLVDAETRVAAYGSGAIAHLYLHLAGREPGGIVAAAERDALIARAREIFSSLRVGEATPIARVLERHELAPLGLDHRNAGDLVLYAAPGFWFALSKPMASRVSFPTPAYGQHGFPNDDPRMAAIYLAWGAGIAPGRLESLSATEVAGRVARQLGIERPGASR